MDFYLQRALDAIQRETSGMSPAQLAWHPHAKWSTAQILEHLSLAFSSTSKVMERGVQEGGTGRRKPTLREWLVTLAVVRVGYFPTGRQAPEWTRPRGLVPANAIENIRSTLVAMDAKIAAAEEKLGSGVVGVHPIIGPLTASQWRKFHWEHTRHHMKQVRALRAAASQP
jgi:Protein of unknown function (DUF1569)